MGRKVRPPVPHFFFFGGGTGSLCNAMFVTWAEAYLRTKWHLDPSSRLATTEMDRKLGRGVLCPPFLGGSWLPSNTMWPGPRSTSMPSFILIHPTVWTQYTNVADRATARQTRLNRQQNVPIAHGEAFYRKDASWAAPAMYMPPLN